MQDLPNENALPEAMRMNAEDKPHAPPPVPFRLFRTFHRRVVAPVALKLIMAILFISKTLPGNKE